MRQQTWRQKRKGGHQGQIIALTEEPPISLTEDGIKIMQKEAQAYKINEWMRKAATQNNELLENT